MVICDDKLYNLNLPFHRGDNTGRSGLFRPDPHLARPVFSTRAEKSDPSHISVGLEAIPPLKKKIIKLSMFNKLKNFNKFRQLSKDFGKLDDKLIIQHLSYSYSYLIYTMHSLHFSTFKNT